MTLKKKVLGKIKIIIPAGKAAPGNPLGPALGQKQVNIMAFCKDFNGKTGKYKVGTPLRTVIIAYADKTYEFEILGIPTTTIIKEVLGIKSGSNEPGRKIIDVLPLSKVEEIAKLKLENDQLNVDNLASATQMIIGSLKSMGIKVEGV